MTKKNRNELSRLPQRDADLMRALYESFLMARRGKLNTNDEFKFEVNWYENLEQLADDIIMFRRLSDSELKSVLYSTQSISAYGSGADLPRRTFL